MTAASKRRSFWLQTMFCECYLIVVSHPKTPKKPYVVLGSAAKSTALALDALPPKLLGGNEHVVVEVETRWMS